MTIRDRLIQAAGDAVKIDPGRSKRERMIEIFLQRQRSDGGFVGKGQCSDLYYTGFAVLSLLALEGEFDVSKVRAYLRTFGTGAGLDLAHLASLIRLRVLLDESGITEADRSALTEKLQGFRCRDGGYHHVYSGQRGSAYGCFLALGAYEDLRLAVDKGAMLDSLAGLKGKRAYYNEPQIPAVSVPATAAALVVRTMLGEPISQADTVAVEWLMECCCNKGGFRVMKIAPVADLLSTAVALHALKAVGADISRIQPSCMAYLQKSWRDEIGFCSNVIDRWTDCEYMYYGLLALGHLC